MKVFYAEKKFQEACVLFLVNGSFLTDWRGLFQIDPQVYVWRISKNYLRLL